MHTSFPLWAAATCAFLAELASPSRTIPATVVVTASDGAAAASSHPTVAEAQRHVRGLRAAGVASTIVLDLSEGTHPPFSVGARDSGLYPNARTVYRGKGPATRISGGTEIPASLFKPSTGANPAVLTADIASLGLDPASFGEIVAAACSPPDVCATTRALLSFDDEEMILARWPNFDRGGTGGGGGGGGASSKGRNVYTHLKSSGGPGGFVYAPDNATVRARALGWAKERGGYLHGYWEFDWADCYRKIEQVEVIEAPTWEVHVAGTEFSTTVGVDGGPQDAFRVSTVASGGPDDPRHGDCNRSWSVRTQNVLERTHDNTTAPNATSWEVVAALACGNTEQHVASASFAPGGVDLNVTFSPADTTPGANARFYATNLLSELDQPGEYYLELTNTTMKVHLIPPPGAGADPAQWRRGPVVGLRDPVVDLSGSRHTSLQSVQVLHSRGTGVLATDVADVQIDSVTSALHTRHGVWLHGTDSSVTNSTVYAVGCTGIRAHGGDAATLVRGNLSVSGNQVHSFARWKRTYQPGIHWAGVGNTYSRNTVTDGPHNCFLGGGNEAEPNSTLAGVDCVFEGNTLDFCAYEAGDAGAFYTCGQMGAAFVNRGNALVNNTFRNVRNTVGTGVEVAGVNAVYLDDDMSGWNITGNAFVNCQCGVWIGGGRRNTVVDNRFERCDFATHLDNRGMDGRAPNAVPNCTEVCEPLSDGCNCNIGAARWMVTESPAAAQWGARFPFLKTLGTDRLDQPAYNTIAGNTFCKCGEFIDATPAQVASWGSTVGNNTEITTCPGHAVDAATATASV